ncbi:MAG: InlB B-repeat-containing protein [Bacteroidales bacterium]|nr:InlB B-repeat-containing protein [Bacteroidales bacterium]
MKKIKQLLSLFIILLAAPQVMAQVISVCAGEDSVRLRLENYQYGKITWMRSYDNENWEIIENATDTVYKFLPEENKYYRAQVIFGDCEPVFSATSYVQTLPKPFAGTDKTLSIGAGIYLSASAQPGVIGQWDIIEGTGGVLGNDTSAYSFFYGTDTTYQLRWTMTNACGSRSDTLKIRYVETIYYDDIVYVDSTDQILSDSAERVNGLYRIIFSAPSVVVTDSSVLIGSMENSFFEKVEHMRRVGDTCIMETRPATLDDILVYGVLNATEVHYIDTVRHAPMPYIILDHLPTRAEMQIPEIRNGHYRIVEGTKLRGLDDLVIPINHDVGLSVSVLTISGSIHAVITPHIQFEYEESESEEIIRLKFGIENGTLELEAGFSIGVAGEIKYEMPIPAIPIPTPAIPTLALRVSPYVALSGSGTFTWNLQTALRINAIVEYRKNATSDNQFNIHKEGGSVSFLPSPNSEGEIELGQGIELYLNLLEEARVFDLGPFVDFSFGNTFQWHSCPNPLRKQTSDYAFLRVGGGCKAGIKCKWIPKLLSFLRTATFRIQNTVPLFKKNNPSYVLSHSLNDMLFQTPNDELEVSVRLFDSWSQPSSNFPVHFIVDANCGSVYPEYVFTDESGVATAHWRPSLSNEIPQILRAEVEGCSSSIKGSPVIFNARNGCLNDNFRIQPTISRDDGRICFQLDNISFPLETYSWSTNGTTYYHFDGNHSWPFNNLPCFNVTPNVPFVFYAKNQNGCVAVCSEVLNALDCDNPVLCLNYTIENNMVAMHPTGGHPGSYHCYIDGNYRPAPHILFPVDPGDHVLRVEDNIGCSVEETITIGTPITVTFNPNCNEYVGTMRDQNLYCNTPTSLNSNTFSRNGYTFIGWNTQSDGSGTQYEDMGTVTLTQDITLYAQWGNDVNRITFHANGGGGTMNPFLAQHGTTTTLPPATYTHPCLTFREWNTRSDGMGDDYRDQATIILCADMELYAIWDSVVAGTVYFYPNGAPQCGTMQQTFYRCSPRELLSHGCEYYAHVFNGWNTSADGTGEPYADRQIVVLEDNLSLYAQWRPADRYSVTFDANGGTGEMPSIEGYENESVQLPEPNLTKENHHFVYWNTASDGSGTTYYPHSYLQLSQNTTLFAQWEQDYYTVTFDANGGEGAMDPQRFYVGTPTRLVPNTFTHPSLVFSHWSTNGSGNGTRYNDQEEIVAEGNFILYAQWTSSMERTSCAVESHHSNETVENGRLVSVRDHEGNVYPVVQMNNGTCWLKTNMQATTSPTTGESLTVRPGHLYNWYAATDSGTVRGICPYGWHVPTYEDWLSGIISYGAPVYISGLGWDASDVANSPGDYSNELRNSTNFSLLPYGKYFINDCAVTCIGSEAWLWLNVNGALTGSYAPSIQYLSQSASPRRSSPSASCYYLSVRCVRD